MKYSLILTDFLKTIRTLKSHTQIIKSLELPTEEKQIIDDALKELIEEIEKE